VFRFFIVSNIVVFRASIAIFDFSHGYESYNLTFDAKQFK